MLASIARKIIIRIVIPPVKIPLQYTQNTMSSITHKAPTSFDISITVCAFAGQAWCNTFSSTCFHSNWMCDQFGIYDIL